MNLRSFLSSTALLVATLLVPARALATSTTTATTLTATPNPSVYGQSVTLNVAVTGTNGNNQVQTGTVTINSAAAGFPLVVTLADGLGSTMISSLPVGNTPMTASYNGDVNNDTSTSSVTTQTVNQASTTSTLTTSPNPSVAGQTVTYTVTVAAVAPGAGTPTGTVTFTTTADGDPVTVPLVAGVGSTTISTLSVASHSVTATYNGDTNFAGSTSNVATQVVNQGSTTTALVSSSNPSVYGQNVSGTITVAAVAPATGTPTGTVTLMAGATPIGTATLVNGVAVVASSALPVATLSVTAVYAGDTNFTTSTSTVVNQVVNQASTSTTLVSSVNPSVSGQSVTLTATVAPVAPGAGAPSGTVTFNIGSVPTTAALVSGVATLTTSTIAVGTNSVTAVYGGDVNFATSTSNTLSQVVNKATTTTALVSSVNPSVYGQSVSGTITVSAVAPGTGTPTGTVTLLAGVTPIGSATLVNGVAVVASSALPVGTLSVTAVYAGDTNFSTSTSTVVNQVVNQAATTTTLASSVNPSVSGQSVTLTATVAAVAPGAGTPSGTVTFTVAGTPSTVPVVGGVASLVTSTLAVASNTVAAVYNGDVNFTGSTATPLSQVVNKASTTSVLAASPNPAVFGQTVTFTATVAAVAPGSGTPTGTATFTIAGGPTLTGTLNGSGVATVTTAALSVGSHSTTVTYNGDANFTTSTSTATTEVVNKASTTSTLAAAPNPTVAGQVVTLTATVAPVAPGAGTATGTVTFTIANGPTLTGTLNGSGVATASTGALSVGSHAVSVAYSGDGNFTTSTSSPTTQVVNQANSSVAVTVSPNPVVNGQTATVSVTVTAVAPGAGIPTGTITVNVGPAVDLIGTLNANGQVSLTVPSLVTGTYAVTATYGGDVNFNPSINNSQRETVVQGGSGVALTTSAASSVFGTAVTLTATLQPQSPGTGTPTGVVTFQDGSVVLGSPGLTAGKATLTTSALNAGVHTITASYAGDSNFTAATSNALSQTITPAPVTVAITNVSPVYDGTAKPVTVTVTPQVTFATTYAGSATAPINAGTYAVSVSVTDPNYAPGPTTATLTIAKANQTVAFTAPAAPAIGTPITLTATASSGLPVTFALTSGNATLSGASLTLADASAVTVRATQAGNANYNAATADSTITASGKLAQTIAFTAPADRLSNAAAFNLTATATSGLPVTFAIVSGPALLNGSTVTLTGVPGLVVIRASQAGNNTYAAAPDVTVSLTITAAGLSEYFGPVNSGQVVVGNFAVTVPAGSSTASMLFVTSAGNLAFDVPIGTNGAFTLAVSPVVSSTSVDDRAHPASAAALTVTVHGTLLNGQLTGVVDPLGLAFTATVVSPTGPSAGQAGYYKSVTLAGTTGAAYSVVGPQNQVLVLATTPLVTTGGVTTLNADGTFALQTTTSLGQATISGAVDARTTTVSGTIAIPNQPTASFAGLVNTTTRTDRLINLSSRVNVGTGANILITGFVISGSAPKPVLVRAVGPSLATFGVNGTLTTPRLRLYQGSTVIAENAVWSTAPNAAAIASAASSVGAFALPANSTDAAILITLAPGAYTAQVFDNAGTGTGVALAEIYDASVNANADYQRLINISTRGQAGLTDNVLIGGFVITGNSPKKVLIRGVGPGLSGYGVTGVLPDPRLRVYAGSTLLAENDNWSSDPVAATALATAATQTGAFALANGSKDAALILTLAPGAYTAQVFPNDTSTGVALVEIYEIP